MSRTINFKLAPDARIKPAFTDREVAFDLSHNGHVLVTLYIQFLRSDWSKFDGWVHALKIYAASWNLFTDSWNWQSFV